jgi:hypothetical protein
MENQQVFILKLIFISTLLSLLIKYSGESLIITPTVPIVIVIILLPTVIMATLLWLRIPGQNSQN